MGHAVHVQCARGPIHPVRHDASGLRLKPQSVVVGAWGQCRLRLPEDPLDRIETSSPKCHQKNRSLWFEPPTAPSPNLFSSRGPPGTKGDANVPTLGPRGGTVASEKNEQMPKVGPRVGTRNSKSHGQGKATLGPTVGIGRRVCPRKPGQDVGRTCCPVQTVLGLRGGNVVEAGVGRNTIVCHCFEWR